MFKLKPLFDRVIVVRDAAEKVTNSGIVIPDKAKEDKLMGVVKAVGDSCKYVKEGDYVLFEKFSGDEMEIEGVKYLIMNEEAIIGIIQ